MASSQAASYDNGMRGPVCYGTTHVSSEPKPTASSVLEALEMPLLPLAPNISFDAAYVSSMAGVRVGGDWFGAFVRPDGNYVLSIGDVQGSGLKAIAPMVNIRAALFALESVCADPVTSLEHLEAFIDCMHPSLFATAFQARYDPRTCALQYANAGHPAPFLYRAEGSVERLTGIDVPLGAGFADGRTLYATSLCIGDVLVVVTDGLIEMTHDIQEGEERITRALCNRCFAAETRPAAWLRRELIATHPVDDVAILTMRVQRA